MHYASVLDAARLIQQLGLGTVLAKVDLQNAYLIVPVHSDDHHLLGIHWGQDIRCTAFWLKIGAQDLCGG